MKNNIDGFETLVSEAESAITKLISTTEFEGALENVLKFIKQNTQLQSTIEEYLINGILDATISHEIIEFCMHDLKWLAIKEKVETELKLRPDPRSMNIYADIIESFSDNWDGREMYAKYR